MSTFVNVQFSINFDFHRAAPSMLIFAI